tara:strand:+ start:221 stop:841 length:621 start_codon:yes stop_codon:yes gene_type:complete
MISPINRDGLVITQPGRLEELYFNAPVNEPLAVGTMPTNVQQGIAPIYNEMVDPNFYENMYQAPPMNLDQKKEAFANNLQTKKQNQGLKGLMTNAMSLLPGGPVIRGLAAINPFIQNTDFAKATSLADYLDMRKYGGLEGRETARRMNQREINEIQGRIDRKLAAGGYDTSQDRGRGQNIPSAPKQSRNTYTGPQQSGGPGGLHSK